MSNCYNMKLPLVAHMRHSARNLELLTHSLVEQTMSWPHELIIEQSTDTGNGANQTCVLRACAATACVVHHATRRC
jgi:hypothetical protein